MSEYDHVLSICIPVYNGSKHLTDCLDSVLGQTVEEFEVLIIDDCSTDDSLELISEYARSDKRFRILRNNSRLGLVPNWNHCALQARGQWMKLLFQDDRMYPKCIECSLEAARVDDVKMVSANRKFIFESEDDPANDYYRNTVKHVCGNYAEQTYVNAEEFSGMIMNYLLTKDVGINFLGEPPNILLHRDVFSELGLFHTGLIQSCDYEFMSRVGSNHGVVLIPEVLSEFRIHSHSTTRSNDRNQRFRKQLDLPAVVYAYLNDSRYTKFREHIGEEGVEKLVRYLTNLLHRIKTELGSSGNDADEVMWHEFRNSYPAIEGLLHEPTARSVASIAKKYVKARSRKVTK